SRRRHTRFSRDWSSDVCSSDLPVTREAGDFYSPRTIQVGLHQSCLVPVIVINFAIDLIDKQTITIGALYNSRYTGTITLCNVHIFHIDFIEIDQTSRFVESDSPHQTSWYIDELFLKTATIQIGPGYIWSICDIHFVFSKIDRDSIRRGKTRKEFFQITAIRIHTPYFS